MAYKTKKLRISQKSSVSVHVGLKHIDVTVRLPIQQITKHALKAVFGKGARVTYG